MKVRRALGFAVGLGLLVTGPRPAAACCMVPATWDGDVDQAEQNAIVLHHDGHEELILRVAPYFQTTSRLPLAASAAAAPPPYLEWVVTVPSPPTAYAVVPASVFGDLDARVSLLQRLAREQEDARTRWEWPGIGRYTLSARDGAVASAPAAGALDVGPLVRVGPYEITPVQARGREALDALNAYLAGRGFPQEDADHMAWFVERGFTFLCVHITPPPGASRLGDRLELEPLRIGFATDRPYYPAKFSSRQGDFALSLATVTSRPVARRSLSNIRGRLDADRSQPNLFTVKALPPSLTGAIPAGVDRWYLNAFRSDGFNPSDTNGRPAISSWTDDVLFDLGGDADEMPGWYYGDRDLWIPERLVREHGIALGVWGVLGAWFAIRVRRRKARRPPTNGPRVPGPGSPEARPTP